MPENNTQLLAPDTAHDLATMTAEQIDAQCAKLERIAEAQTRLIMTALKTKTRNKDWIDFGGKPYLTGDGAERLCAVGIRLGTPMFDVRHDGEDIIVDCLLEASWHFTGQTVTGLGSCSTRDKLYGTSEYELCLARAEGSTRLARKLLEGHIKKKAQKNATGRAVSAVMGISGLSWDDLKPYGIILDGAGARVDFKKGATAATRSAAKKDVRRSTVAELLKLGKGSITAVGGAIRLANAFAKFWKFAVRDETGECTIIIWKQEPLPDIAAAGNEVFFPKVEVREYQGSPQYVASSIELAGGDEESPA